MRIAVEKQCLTKNDGSFQGLWECSVTISWKKPRSNHLKGYSKEREPDTSAGKRQRRGVSCNPLRKRRYLTQVDQRSQSVEENYAKIQRPREIEQNTLRVRIMRQKQKGQVSVYQ